MLNNEINNQSIDMKKVNTYGEKHSLTDENTHELILLMIFWWNIPDIHYHLWSVVELWVHSLSKDKRRKISKQKN